jgi:hypothetical protein
MCAQMNVRSLCFARVARERGEPWLWWEFVDKLGAECRMKDKLFTQECAQKVRAGAAHRDGHFYDMMYYSCIVDV